MTINKNNNNLFQNVVQVIYNNDVEYYDLLFNRQDNIGKFINSNYLFNLISNNILLNEFTFVQITNKLSLDEFLQFLTLIKNKISILDNIQSFSYVFNSIDPNKSVVLLDFLLKNKILSFRSFGHLAKYLDQVKNNKNALLFISLAKQDYLSDIERYSFIKYYAPFIDFDQNFVECLFKLFKQCDYRIKVLNLFLYHDSAPLKVSNLSDLFLIIEKLFLGENERYNQLIRASIDRGDIEGFAEILKYSSPTDCKALGAILGASKSLIFKDLNELREAVKYLDENKKVSFYEGLGPSLAKYINHPNDFILLFSKFNAVNQEKIYNLFRNQLDFLIGGDLEKISSVISVLKSENCITGIISTLESLKKKSPSLFNLKLLSSKDSIRSIARVINKLKSKEDIQRFISLTKDITKIDCFADKKNVTNYLSVAQDFFAALDSHKYYIVIDCLEKTASNSSIFLKDPFIMSGLLEKLSANNQEEFFKEMDKKGLIDVESNKDSFVEKLKLLSDDKVKILSNNKYFCRFCCEMRNNLNSKVMYVNKIINNIADNNFSKISYIKNFCCSFFKSEKPQEETMKSILSKVLTF